MTGVEKENVKDQALPPKTQMYPGELEFKLEEVILTPRCVAMICLMILTRDPKVVDSKIGPKLEI